MHIMYHHRTAGVPLMSWVTLRQPFVSLSTDADAVFETKHRCVPCKMNIYRISEHQTRYQPVQCGVASATETRGISVPMQRPVWHRVRLAPCFNLASALSIRSSHRTQQSLE